MNDPENDAPSDLVLDVPLIEDTRLFRREFILEHGMTRYVAEVNGISIADAQAVIADGRVDVAYLRKSLRLDT